MVEPIPPTSPVSALSAPHTSRIQALDMGLCYLMNRANRRQTIGQFFALISRLGDGVFWYSLMLILPVVYGVHGLLVSLHMALTGVVALLVYKWLKARTSRPRPFMVSQHIIRRVPPLDEYSFPSGHTLHAVTFTLVVLQPFPQLFWLVVPFTVLVALSRMVLGLHYPSDVLAGATIGAVIALGSMSAVQLV